MKNLINIARKICDDMEDCHEITYDQFYHEFTTRLLQALEDEKAGLTPPIIEKEEYNMQQQELFAPEWGVDQSPTDQTEITTTILYFSKEELREFKTLCREGIKKEFGEEFQQRGNLSDLLLKLLREKYGNVQA